jgi:hypothetical protein
MDDIAESLILEASALAPRGEGDPDGTSIAEPDVRPEFFALDFKHFAVSHFHRCGIMVKIKSAASAIAVAAIVDGSLGIFLLLFVQVVAVIKTRVIAHRAAETPALGANPVWARCRVRVAMDHRAHLRCLPSKIYSTDRLTGGALAESLRSSTALRAT